MNLNLSDYFLLAFAVIMLVFVSVSLGLALLAGGALYHLTDWELKHRFMNQIRKECDLAPKARLDRYKNLPLLKNAKDLPPLAESDRSWSPK